MELVRKIKKQIKKSHFVVNKLYLFIIFIFLTIGDFTLGIIYFILSFFIYIKKILTATVPMEIKQDINMETYIYKTTDDKDLKMDIYYPNEKKEKYPIVYFCHGGGWISGFRDQANNVSWCKFLASRGLAVASIDYRFGYRNNMMDLISDYYDGIEYIRDNKETLSLDTDNMVLMGLSAGAHLSLLYSTYLTYKGEFEHLKGIKSVVAYYPPTDLNELLEDKDSKSLLAKFGAMRTLKDSPDENGDVYTDYSPITWVSDNMIPTLLVHGKKDDTVPFISSVNFAKELKKHNISYEFLVHNNANHSFDTRLNDYTTVNILEKTVRYIKKSIS